MLRLMIGFIIVLSTSAFASEECSQEINLDQFESSENLNLELKETLKQGLIDRGFVISSSSPNILKASQTWTAPCVDVVNVRIDNTQNGEVLFEKTFKRCDLGMRREGSYTNMEKLGHDIANRLEIPEC